ncbi:signal transduction histidine kinase [Marinomonas alcarazii]|uniref:histidine kinase n=1 Tax=Marinomonas alcarazii TaxID=491949 RepID=A0A318UU64_9GAMM|nr:HAMP domain-containing sensor histidine kinase [Marinomonas alcarazii]PYF78977.1 signal transduction histidine kinase [Marinomonas alcarazii]
MRLFPEKMWLSIFKQWVLYGFIIFIITVSLAIFSIITYTNDGSKNNSRRVFESSLWNALQLQLQSYRFLNYLIELDQKAPSLNGEAFFRYDVLMSRVDLLRKGEIGELIRNFEGGRTTRLLNIINGEMELLSFQLSKIEAGDYSYLPTLVERIKSIDTQVNEFVTLVNKGSNTYISEQHKTLQKNLDTIQLLSMILVACLLSLAFFAMKGLVQLRHVFKLNNNLNDNIKAVHEDKARMLTFINQETRAPINAILGIASTLNNTESPKNTENLAKHIQESGNQLLQIIEMLSDLALIDAKKLTLVPTIEPLKSSIEDCLSLFESQMARKNLQSIVYIDPNLPDFVCLDLVRTKEIIVALLQNAINHTPTGSISLQVRPSASAAPVIPLPAGTKEVSVMQIVLRDTGQGMADELQQNLRINPSLPMQQEGPLPSKVGLSLALCHKLVYLMKGEMHFSCAPQKGCEFWVDIPFYITDSAPTLKQHKPPQCPDNTQALLIETDAQLAKIISLQLATMNISVSVSKDGSMQDNRHCNLVILGNTANFERDGQDALQQWKNRSCPVISYQPLAINNPDFQVKPLHFPITQSQLETHIAKLFANKKPFQGATQND